MKHFLDIKEELMKLSLPIGLIIVTAYPEYNIVFANERFKEMLGFENEEKPMQFFRKSAWDCIYSEDIGWLKAMAADRNGESELYEIAYRAVKKDGSIIWINQCSQHMLDENNSELVYAYYTDITAQKQTEQALLESESRYALAIKASNINIWEYDYNADTMTIFSTSPKVTPQKTAIPDYLHSVVAESHIREDCVPLFFNMIEKLKNGEKAVTADLWIRERSTDNFWCERVIYTNIFDNHGKPIKAYCVGRDVTREKEAEKRYRDELYYRKAMQKATMASINVNLTKDMILDYKSIFKQVTKHMRSAKTVQDYFDQVYTELTTPEMQQECAAVFNRDALLRCFANGETTVSMELSRKIDGRRYWTILTAHMMKQAENNDVVAFLYSTNVTNERTMQSVMNAIVKTDYDFLVVVDAQRNSAVRYSEKSLGNCYAYESECFEEETQEYVRRYVCEEDVSRVVGEITLTNILAQLDAHETYSIFYKVPNAKGGSSQKQLHFSYIHREQRSFLMTRTDITAAVEEQEKKNRELVAAVKMAEHANAAKSEFLSRISHEIRTPMNAIMGMNQLVSQHLDDQAFVDECIKKSQYASQYLLLLINDILDMSKIESGKVILKKERILCQQLLDAVNTIIGIQAQTKGVRYLVTEFENRQSSYWGDSVRLQQILINILSNAVKFTPQGGTVHLDITQTDADGKTVMICFKISDTGIGISKEFLPNLFKPFSQEHSSSTSGYGGSGLGLAISKNLVLLMGGDIFAESVCGEGTTFFVKIPLQMAETPTEILPPKINSPCEQKYDFSGKTILLVEDHQLNVLVARKLLEFKNAHVEVAENGQIALTMFAAAPEHGYDAILMDIRMPVMDGLQAAEHIRNLDSVWAKAVPIIAMSANAFDEDVCKSKNAGMNAHLAKPIDAELLYQTLDELCQNGGKSNA